jgi:hypothetical protein
MGFLFGLWDSCCSEPLQGVAIVVYYDASLLAVNPVNVDE